MYIDRLGICCTTICDSSRRDLGYQLSAGFILHPIRLVEQGDYHVIVLTKYSGVQHPTISILLY